MSEDDLVYFLDNKTYINLTNKCTSSCLFCIRNLKDDVKGANMRLKRDATSSEVIEQIKNAGDKIKNEITFCGYGEPLIKLNEVLEIADFIRKNYPGVKIRVNTNGHANLIHKRNVVPELKGRIDSISVSLNAENEELYNEISRPSRNFQNMNVYGEVKNFISECTKNGIDTTATIVTGYKDPALVNAGNLQPDEKKCEQVAKSLGAKFRVRPWLDNGY